MPAAKQNQESPDGRWCNMTAICGYRHVRMRCRDRANADRCLAAAIVEHELRIPVAGGLWSSAATSLSPPPPGASCFLRHQREVLRSILDAMITAPGRIVFVSH